MIIIATCDNINKLDDTSPIICDNIKPDHISLIILHKMKKTKTTTKKTTKTKRNKVGIKRQQIIIQRKTQLKNKPIHEVKYKTPPKNKTQLQIKPIHEVKYKNPPKNKLKLYSPYYSENKDKKKCINSQFIYFRDKITDKIHTIIKQTYAKEQQLWYQNILSKICGIMDDSDLYNEEYKEFIKEYTSMTHDEICANGGYEVMFNKISEGYNIQYQSCPDRQTALEQINKYGEEQYNERFKEINYKYMEIDNKEDIKEILQKITEYEKNKYVKTILETALNQYNNYYFKCGNNNYIKNILNELNIYKNEYIHKILNEKNHIRQKYIQSILFGINSKYNITIFDIKA